MANRGKRSVVADLARPEDRRLVLGLVGAADVVVQNYRPGVAERLGVGYEQLRKVRPDLVFVAVTGWGREGPYSQRRAYDSVVQAASGWCALQGGAGPDAEPAFVANVVCDKLAALSAAQAAVAALHARDRGCGGQRVDVSMLEVSAAWLWVDEAGDAAFPDAEEPVASGVTPRRRCLRFADGWGMVSIGNDRDFRGLCQAFGVDPDDFPELATPAGRRDRVDRLWEALDRAEKVSSALTRDEGAARLDALDVAFGMVRSVAELPDDPQLRFSGLFREVDDPRAGRIVEPSYPVRFSATPTAGGALSPDLDQDGPAVRAELAES